MHDEFGFSPKPWEERYQLSMRQHSTGLLFRLEQIREGGRKPVAALLELLTSNAGKRELVVVEVVAQGSNHLLKNISFYSQLMKERLFLFLEIKFKIIIF